MRPVLVSLLSALVLAVPLVATPCRAQFLRANLTLFDPSIASAGMAGASVAAFWFDTPNVWINPALASFQRGVRYSFGSTQLAPGLAGDVSLETHQIFVGAHGIGVEMSGKPIDGLGKTRLEYGELDLTDPFGNETEVHPYEELRSFSIGVDLVTFATSIREASTGELSPTARRVSIAVGHTWKELEAELVGFGGSPLRGTIEMRDMGALLRVAMVDGIGPSLRQPSATTRWRVEVGAGYSEQDYDKGHSPRGWIRKARALTQVGASARFTMAHPSSGDGRIWDLASPAIALGLAWTSTDEAGPATNRYGAELSLWEVFYVRGGFVDDDGGEIHSGTWGGGVCLEYRDAVGVRFDYAKYSQHEDLDEDLDRIGASAFVDPYRLWKELR